MLMEEISGNQLNAVDLLVLYDPGNLAKHASIIRASCGGVGYTLVNFNFWCCHGACTGSRRDTRVETVACDRQRDVGRAAKKNNLKRKRNAALVHMEFAVDIRDEVRRGCVVSARTTLDGCESEAGMCVQAHVCL